VLVPVGARADVITVAVNPETAFSRPGTEVSVQILAVIPEQTPVLGWGLHLAWDTTVLNLSRVVIADLWLSVSGQDSGQLGGLALVPVSGVSVSLADVTFMPIKVGKTAIDISVMPGDLTQGFILDTYGFADTSLSGASIVVQDTPEPASLNVVAGGAVMVMLAFSAMRGHFKKGKVTYAKAGERPVSR
jgi:hypothetical protein